MTPSEVERRYFELKGRQASGLLSEAEFIAAVRDLLAHDRTGRAWTIDPRTGGWLVHDGERWQPAPEGPPPEPVGGTVRSGLPAAPRRLQRLPVVLATLLVLLVAVNLIGPLGRTGLGFGQTTRVPVGAAAAPTAVPPSTTSQPPAAPPAATPAGAFPSAAEVEAAAELVQRLMAVYTSAPSLEAARDATRPFFVDGIEQRPAYYAQLFDVPLSRRLRPADGFRIVQKTGAGPGLVAVVAEATYTGSTATESKLGWAFIVQRVGDGWRIASVQLNTAI